MVPNLDLTKTFGDGEKYNGNEEEEEAMWEDEEGEEQERQQERRDTQMSFEYLANKVRSD
jgi:hypothetical protein